MSDVFTQVDELVARLKAAKWSEREAIKDELLALGQAHNSDGLRSHLDSARKGVSLEVRWEIDEVIDALTPPPAPVEPEPEPEPEPEADPNKPLRMSDLKEVYADPRGIWLFTDKPGKRWFLQQVDQYSGQPRMMELNAAEVEQVKGQLKGSPYWRLGTGVVPS